MTTIATAVDTTRRDHLLVGYRPQRNRLTSSVGAADTTLTFDFDLDAIAKGARLALGYELAWVWSTSGNTATVERGDDSTTAAAHAAGTVVDVNHPYPRARVLAAMADEVRALSAAGLYRMRTVDLTFNESVMGYDLTGVSDVDAIYEVRVDTSGPEKDWPVIDSWEIARNMPTTEFASGTALILRDMAESGRTVRVRYKAPFGEVSDTTDDLTTDLGVPATAEDLVTIGTALRMLPGREVRRNMIESQGDTRRAEEVPPGAQLQSSRGLLALWERRLMEEKGRLLGQYPPRRKTSL